MESPPNREQWVEAAWNSLIAGHQTAVRLPQTNSTGVAAVLPGAFNPLHEGHLEMSQVASRILGVPVEFELSIENVDKPMLNCGETIRRASQFTDGQPLWLTRAAAFVAKSQVFREATFVVGADTIRRVGLAGYYGGDFEARDRAIDSIVNAGCRFLVFGRYDGSHFQTAATLELPDALRQICRQIDERHFRRDISSTELRQANQRMDE